MGALFPSQTKAISAAMSWLEEEAKKVLYLAIFPLHFRKHPFLTLCHVPMSGLQMLSSARLDIGITSHKNALEPRPAPCTYSTWQPSAKSLCTGNKPRINVNTLILQDLQAAFFLSAPFHPHVDIGPARCSPLGLATLAPCLLRNSSKGLSVDIWILPPACG
ncbi:hypothetical protein QC761_206740 [Podospora bellae-mahoneyi]|uniref:Uncharacterized protein n=1 Tax=Podospora bellae-mahoneyi TaxID=2093777 RepID=A0ABR0FTA5_9PEZI|nr:hypothetical protein QC761_206740 [Podospora bellae-mahoneyi]